ncbi:MAG: phenylalanine--tRNA ligase subunit beta, partial [Bdellovibrionaceae bacterium]|nr:phenylalanine--tRNA ligase subunit beta [Pseudobdellovibrionaceae bacterium]
FDMEQEMDIVEEYARLNGYEKIQETLPIFDRTPTHHDAFYTLKNKISAVMQASGFSQAFNYAFTSQTNEQKFMQSAKAIQTYGFKVDDDSVTIRNPLSEEWNAMRRLTSFSIWKNTTENFHMGNERGQLFEIGSAFSKADGTYIESNRLAISSWGNEFGLYSNSTPNVYKVRASIERLFAMLGMTSYTFKELDVKVPFLHYGQSASIVVEGQAVGFIGTVHPQLIQQEKVRVDVAIAELNLDIICQGQPRPMRFKSVSNFQAVERDFSFVVDANKSMGEFMTDVKKSLGGVCKDIRIFDIYQGDKLDSKQKSVSVRVTMQSGDAELTETQITENVTKIMASAEKIIGAKLR